MKSKLDIFDDNSSTRDALLDFACGNINLLAFRRLCWPKECKKYISQELIPIGEDKARKRIKRWIWKNGYTLKG